MVKSARVIPGPFSAMELRRPRPVIFGMPTFRAGAADGMLEECRPAGLGATVVRMILKYVVQTADGRHLTTQTYGDPDGSPVFLLHGTPGSRLGPHPRAAVLHRLGVRLIAFDRPGYGGSDRMQGRLVADVAADVRAIADDYQLPRFAVVGRSGGGPHALACAALLPERVTRAAVLVGLAPRGAAGLDANPAYLVSQLQADLPDLDRRVVADSGIRSMLIETYAEALRSSDYGWIDDAVVFCLSWGFDPADVTVPVLLWHGASDRFSPASHARWLADRIPAATVHVQPDAAHFGALDVLPDVLRWLAGRRAA
jgi:pimeloyl-ACP methyl ester carboxylesterase